MWKKMKYEPNETKLKVANRFKQLHWQVERKKKDFDLRLKIYE